MEARGSASVIGIPDLFELAFPGEPVQRSRLIWRKPSPGVASANSRQDQLEPPIGPVSPLVRFANIVLALALLGLLIGMLIATSR
jgi:hypothetical protein